MGAGFLLLTNVPGFVHHNFRATAGELETVPDPSSEIDEAICSPQRDFPEVVEVLRMTLSTDCFTSFLRTNPHLPIKPRDYYLSKLYQFFHIAFLNQSSLRSQWPQLSTRLYELLDQTIPDWFADWNNLSSLDWQELFRKNGTRSPESLVECIPRALGIGVAGLGGAVVAPAKTKGRPVKYGGMAEALLAAETGADIQTQVKIAMQLTRPPTFEEERLCKKSIAHHRRERNAKKSK
jgi:hypothetical protein